MKSLKRWLLILVGVLLIAGVLRLLFFTSCYIPNQGMENSLMQGDHIIINKTSYGFKLPFSNTIWGAKSPKRGDIVLFYNPYNAQSSLSQKEIYIGRCMGLPGDTLAVNTEFQLEEENIFFNPDQKRLYGFHSSFQAQIDSIAGLLELNLEPSQQDVDSTLTISLSSYEHYLISDKLSPTDTILTLQEKNLDLNYPFIVPQKGTSIKIEPWNRALIYNTVLLHENRAAQIKQEQLWIAGRAVEEYTFTQNYYWMVADNSKNTLDSRQFGLVPESHIIGKASLIWLSKDPSKNIFTGYRWNRFLKFIY